MAETRLAGQAVPSILRQSCADCRVVGRIHSFGPRCRPRGGYSAPARRLWDSRGRRGGPALGDAGSASCVAGLNSQGVLRHADRRSFHSLLLHGSVPRPALDFCPSPRHLRALHAIPHRHCSIVRCPTAHYRAYSRLAPYFYLRGRISCHGGAINSHVGSPNGFPLGLYRCYPIVVCAVLSLGLYR